MQKLSKAKQNKVVQLWLDRKSKTAIAQHLGLGRATVYRVLWERFTKPLPSVESAIALMENSRKTKNNASNQD